MDFEPKAWVFFCKTGIDDQNKVVCKNQDDLYNISAGGSNQLGVLSDTSFQRADGYFTVRVDHSDISYYKLLQADTVVYRNDDTDGAFWIWCNILSVEWKNPDCSFVKFKIDHFMTYQDKIDWDNTYAFIEREHIKEDWSSDGGNPLFSNMGPAEDFGTVADTPLFTWEKNYEPNLVIVHTPYDGTGKAQFEGQLVGHLYSSLRAIAMTPDGANTYFKAIADAKEASINNIVGVMGIPENWRFLIMGGGTLQESETLEAINIAAKANPNNIEYNNGKCWSSPFCVVRLFSSDGDTKDFTTQWFGNDVDDYSLEILVTGSGGQFGGAAAAFKNKNGTFNWKTWADFTVMIRELPSCPWTGDGFTDWASVNLRAVEYNAMNTVWHNNGRLFNQAAKFLTGEGGNPVTSGMQMLTTGYETISDYIGEGLNLAAQINQQKAAGASVNGVGSTAPLFDIANEAWGFKVIYYGTQPYMMQCVDAYFDRFGYRVNRLKKLELENRPIWTFIKTAECHVLSKEGIPYISEVMINRMFNHGVTMWKLDKYKSGVKPGDFSRAHDNRGIKG